jgi:hypothetical protein
MKYVAFISLCLLGTTSLASAQLEPNEFTVIRGCGELIRKCLEETPPNTDGLAYLAICYKRVGDWKAKSGQSLPFGVNLGSQFVIADVWRQTWKIRDGADPFDAFDGCFAKDKAEESASTLIKLLSPTLPQKDVDTAAALLLKRLRAMSDADRRLLQDFGKLAKTRQALAPILGLPANNPTTFIDQELATYWQTNKITPSERCGDHAFLRRASLDLIGRIPTVPEIAAYMNDKPDQRRLRLIERLLSSDEAPRHWADLWTHWLLGLSGSPEARDAFHGWLEQHFAKAGSHREMVEKLLLVTGSTRDNPAGHFIALHRGLAVPEKNSKFEGKNDMFPLTGKVFRVLHGRQLECLQCHDHPHDLNLHQVDFHEMNLFFRQVDVAVLPGKDSVAEISDNPALSETPRLTIEWRRRPVGAVPRFYGVIGWKPAMKQTRREAFTKRFIEHPDFARGYVNRIWTQLFGHGLCESPAADDFGVHNPVVHERILERLTRDLLQSKYDPKALLRWICQSECYALSSVANKTNDARDKDVAFARQQARPLSNEQLVESLLTAVQYPVDERAKMRRTWQRELYQPRFDEEGVSHKPLNSCGEFTPREDYATLRMVWLMYGKSFDDALNHKNGTLAAILKEHPKLSAAAIEKLYMHTLSRPPTPRELKHLTDLKTMRLGPQLDPNTEKFWRGYATDIFWALLNSAEFSLNH